MNTENEISRNEVIHAKGFDMHRNSNEYYSDTIPTEYKKIKVGVKNLDDAILNLGSIKSSLPRNGYANKAVIMSALADNNLEDLRNISNFYYNLSGIYQRICNYFAFLYRYDWYVVPESVGEDVKEDKVLKDFAKVLNYLDNSNVRKICGDIALSVIKEGAYYGYIVPSAE